MSQHVAQHHDRSWSQRIDWRACTTSHRPLLHGLCGSLESHSGHTGAQLLDAKQEEEKRRRTAVLEKLKQHDLPQVRGVPCTTRRPDEAFSLEMCRAYVSRS